MKVKVTCFWKSDDQLLNDIKLYGFGKAAWKDIKFVSGNQFDKLIILTHPFDNHHSYDHQKAITLLTEPPLSANLRPHPTSATLPMYLPLPFWAQIAKTSGSNRINIREQLGRPIKKTMLLSSICSDYNFLEGHTARLELIYYLDKRIGEGFDTWGKQHGDSIFFNQIRSYKGELANKYDALWSYQYHFACENSFCQNYFTEKICDPIIAECLCFYDGCTNIQEFIDERSFVKINVKDPMIAMENIIKNIRGNIWKKKISYIKKQKMRMLTTLHPLNIIWMAAKEMDLLTKCKL